MDEVELIDEQAIRRVLEPLGFDWHYSQDTESTNVDVLRYHERRQRQVVALSESQSAGRGRRGREWISPFARNIYCTIGITKSLPADNLGLLSIVTGIAICRALQGMGIEAIALKWPNDLLCDGRKFGGILIESRPLPDGAYFFAIGFGLNVFMSAQELASIPQPTTSLALVSTVPLCRTRVLGAVLESVIGSVQAFEVSAVKELISQFQQFDAFHGRAIEVISASRKIRGINRGISATGQLQLETDAGIELHSAAEISLRAVR